MPALYDTFTPHFDAVVTSCTPDKVNTYLVTLDRSYFFPEGGGQGADHGFLGAAAVTHVAEHDGAIIHTVTSPLTVGETVHCAIDEVRHRDLAVQHTGEHILSGLLCARHHASNVGFHLSDDVVTIDFDVELTADDVAALELAANEAVQADLPILVRYPDADTLAALPYRSKKELTGEIRLVEIPGIDLCACCGAHVERTGEVGLIKVLTHQRYKGGVRLTMVSGMRAVRDAMKKHDTVAAIALRNSCKHDDVPKLVEKCELEVNALKIALGKAQIAYYSAVAATLPTDKPALFFADADADVQKFALTLAETVPTAAVFAGTDGSYRYALASSRLDLRTLRNDWNGAISGKGGGSDALLTGKSVASRTDIETAFYELFA